MNNRFFSTIGIEHYLFISAIIFVIGIYGVIANRRNIISILMSIELMLLAANINFIAFAHLHGDLTGEIAAAEAAIGLAILVGYNKSKGNIELEDFNLLKG